MHYLNLERYISNARKMSHTSNLFSKYNILKFQDLTKLNEISFMHKYVNNKLPNSFSNKFVKLSNFDRSVSFQLEVVKKSFLKTLPAYSMPKHWNSLPLELKRVASLSVFKNRYKEKILNSYNTSCTVKNAILIGIRLSDSVYSHLSFTNHK